MLLTLFGWRLQNSAYCYGFKWCLWCKIHKLERFAVSKPKDRYDSQPIARTLSEMQEMYSLTWSQRRYSCVRKPLFNITLDHVIL